MLINKLIKSLIVIKCTIKFKNNLAFLIINESNE